MTRHDRPAAATDPDNKPDAVSPPRGLSNLTREIVAILAIKVAVLFAIWSACFSAPEARHMRMPPERVQQRLLEAPAAQVNRSLQSANSGNQEHAAH